MGRAGGEVNHQGPAARGMQGGQRPTGLKAGQNSGRFVAGFLPDPEADPRSRNMHRTREPGHAGYNKSHT